MTIKRIVTQTVGALFIFVAMIACDKAEAKEHTHTSAEIADADRAALEAHKHATHCLVYESMSTKDDDRLKVFRRRMGAFNTATYYNAGYAEGQVVGTAFTLVASSYKVALHTAAQMLYKRYKCSPVEDT